jgi:hypothetical protein
MVFATGHAVRGGRSRRGASTTHAQRSKQSRDVQRAVGAGRGFDSLPGCLWPAPPFPLSSLSIADPSIAATSPYGYLFLSQPKER